jgi:hypothetical protein
LFGEGGNDTIVGAEAGDFLVAGAGDDTVEGGAGNDNVVGGAGNDSLAGDAGNDTLTGSNGNDTLNGGADADQLTGDEGEDTFAFNTAAAANGDSVADFTSGEDTIDVQNVISGDFNFQSVADASGSSFEANDLVFNQANSELLGFLSSGSSSDADFSISIGGDEPVVDDIAGAVTAGPQTVAVDSTGTDDSGSDSQEDAGSGEFEFAFSQGSYSYTVNNFSGDDVLDFTDFSNLSFNVLTDSDQSDGQQQITASSASTNQTATVTLTGLTEAQDGSVFNQPSFESEFGADSLLV